MMIDTHAHIYSEYYDDIEALIKRANDTGVEKIINCSTKIEDFDETIKASLFDNVYYTLGIHPEEANDVNYLELETAVSNNLNNPKFIGIGEIGLDYYHNKENTEEQKTLFKFQLNIAKKYNLPVIIHSREATKDVIDILKEYDLKGIIHCFSGSVETAREYIKMGYKLGIGGLVTFKNCSLKENIAGFGLENIVLETDSPYVTPEPFRGKINEPSYIPIIAEKVANIFELNITEIEKITTKNCNEIFDFNRVK